MEIKDLIYITYYFSLSALILPISIGVFTWKNQSPAMRYFIAGLAIFALIMVFSLITAKLGFKNNLFLQYTASALDCLFVGLCFALAFKNLNIKRFIHISTALIVAFTIVDAILITGYKNFTSYSSTVKSISLIILFVFYLIKLIRYPNLQSLTKVPLFWIATIHLFTSSMGIISDFFMPYFFDNAERYTMLLITSITFIIEGTCTLLYTIPIWKAAHEPTFARLQI